MTKKTTSDPLDSLRGGTSAIEHEHEHEHTGDTVMLDYRGKAGPEQLFEHYGDLVLLTTEEFRLRPGLNIISRELYDRHKDSLRRESVKVVGPDLHEYSSRAALLGLVKRTLSANALDLLLRLEKAKSHTGPGKQDARILELLESRAKAAARQGEPDLAGIMAMAQQQAAALKRKPELAKAG